ncbi:MAG TPA: ATP-binding protein [Ktedonobacteraceae bacterium]|nr:ATP-binding protein [Ktedonobacteraceae bacterium]
MKQRDSLMFSENSHPTTASARLLTTLQRLLELSAIHRGETLHKMAQLVSQALEGEKVVVFLYDAAGQNLTAQGTSMTPIGDQEKAIGLDGLPLEDWGQIAEVYRTGQSYCNGQAHHDPVAVTEMREEPGIKSEMAVSLEIDAERRGVLFASSSHPNHFTEQDLCFLEAVSHWIGVVLHRAEQVEQQTREERAWAEDTLSQQAALLQLAYDGFMVHDEQNRVIFWSKGAAILYGWSEQEAMGKVISDLLHTQFPLPLSEIHEILRREGIWQGELEDIARNGKLVIVDSRWQLIEQQDGLSLRVLEVNRDITERVRLEHDKDEFISMASHELKTPVTSLKGFTHILQHRLTKQGDEQGLHYLARMDAQLNRLTSLISDLLDLSRIQLGKLVLRMEPFDLDALIYETVENVQAVTSTHRLLVEGRTGMQMLGDKERLGQVVINLLTNAIKYSPGADTVLVQLSQDSEQAIVSVQDFGIGIDKSHHESLFERFYRVTGPEEKTYPGLGIGLSISREIVERHYGRIWVKSSKGKGCTFFVALPSSREWKEGLNAEDGQKNPHRGR